MTTKVLMTAEEFAKTGPETDGFDLVKGELVPMPPPRRQHGIVCSNVNFVLRRYCKQLGHGVVLCNDAGLITQRGPDSVRGVDVIFIAHSPWTSETPESYVEIPPDLAVEVRSDKQPWKDLLEKTTEYISLGARMVWIVDPNVRRLTVFEPDREPITYAAENDFDGRDVLPGLHFSVAELFEQAFD